MTTDLAIAPTQVAFQASWPDALNPDLQSTCSKVVELAWLILSIVIFPIGLARLAAYGLRLLVSCIIMPGSLCDEEVARAEGQTLLSNFPQQRRIKITSPDGVELDAVLFRGLEKKKVIVCGLGNCQSWEQISEGAIRLLLSTGASVLMFNPRGIVDSKGYKDFSKLELDVYAVSDYLIKEEGFDPEDLLYYAFSLSGGYMIEGAALVQEQYPEKKIKAISRCSFATLSKAAEELAPNILRSIGVCTCCAGFLGQVGGFLIRLVSAEIDSKTAWDKLKGKKCVVYSKGDETVLYAASLHQAIKLDNQGEVTQIKLKCNDLKGDPDCLIPGWGSHCEFTLCGAVAILEEMTKLLELDVSDRLLALQIKIEETHPKCLCKKEMKIIPTTTAA